MLAMRRAGVTRFDDLPEAVPPLAWPTESRLLLSHPERYVARTRVNPEYGKPGWTRDCGKRFHRGVDIVPVRVTPAGRSVTVLFSDSATGREYPSAEPAWIPEDTVFAVAHGRVVEVNASEDASDFGLFVVVQHEWPETAFACFTLYAHLASVDVSTNATVQAGTRLGALGQTSRIADARAWMAIAPHLHFEVLTPDGGAYDPLQFLQRGLKKTNHE